MTFHPQIEFDKEIFYPGEEVTGRAWLANKTDQKARKVEITFEGKSIASWNNKNNNAVEDGVHKMGEEVYVNMKHEVWTPEDDENTFPAGDYEWKFSFELPRNCPTSFEGKFGFIRYSVRLSIDIPYYPDEIVERPVTVYSELDLNQILGAGQPVEKADLKQSTIMGCCPFIGGRGGSVKFVMSSPTAGYVSGQVLNLTANIENQTRKVIHGVTAELYQKSIFFKSMDGPIRANKNVAQTPDSRNSKTEKWMIQSSTEVFDVPHGGNKTYEFSFVIPPVVATIRGSKIVHVEYYVRFYVDNNSCYDFEAELPIVIGNVPLKGVTALPPQKFLKGPIAKCWNSKFNSDFAYQFSCYSSE